MKHLDYKNPYYLNDKPRHLFNDLIPEDPYWMPMENLYFKNPVKFILSDQFVFPALSLVLNLRMIRWSLPYNKENFTNML